MDGNTLASSIRVMSYNVRYFAHSTKGVATTGRNISKIAQAISSLNPLPDFICLQEVETQSIRSNTLNKPWHEGETQLDRFMTEIHSALREVQSRTSYQSFYFPAHRYKMFQTKNIYTTGLVVLAKKEFENIYSNGSSPYDITHRKWIRKLKQTRICAHSVFQDSFGNKMDIFNTHLSLPNFASRDFWTKRYRMGYAKNQLEEAKNLVQFIEKEKQSSNYLVLGDFNSLPGSPVDDFLQQSKLSQHFRQKIQNEKKEKWSTSGFLNLRMHLDHIYSSSSIDWIDSRDTIPFGKEGPFMGLSDHVPLIGNCRIKKPTDFVKN